MKCCRNEAVRNKGEVGAVKTCLSPPVNFFTGCSKAVLLLWIFFLICVSCLFCYLVCSLQPCGHMLPRAEVLALLCVMFSCVFVTFPYGVLGQVWYLIVSIPDLGFLHFYGYWVEG